MMQIKLGFNNYNKVLIKTINTFTLLSSLLASFQLYAGGNFIEKNSFENEQFSIHPISDVTVPEYTKFDVVGYVGEEFDEVGHYTSITPVLDGKTPFGRVVYTLEGADASEFVVNKKTGQVNLDYKDFEHPTDANGDNVYEITLRVTDEANHTDTESWKVSISDQSGDENPARHMLSLHGSSLMRIKAGETFIDPGVSLIPADAGNNVAITSIIVSDYNLDPPLSAIDSNNPKDRTYHIIYSAIDSVDDNLSAPDRTRTVIVEDANDFASLGAITSIQVTANDGNSKSFSSLDEDYIQKALYFARDHNGGEVKLAPGIHYFKRQLVIYSNTDLVGTMVASKKMSTLKYIDYGIRKAWKNSSISFGNVHPLIINSSMFSDNVQFPDDITETRTQNIGIKDLIYDGNRENQRSWRSAGSNNSIGMNFYHADGITIDNITLSNTLSDGISTKDCTDLNVTNSSFRRMGHSALYFVFTDNVLTDNLTIDVLSNSGIRFHGGQHFTITNNHIFATTNGGNYGIQLSHNYSEGVGDELKDILIENNIIRHTAYAGIALYTSNVNDVIENVQIRNNIIYQCGTAVPNMPVFLAKEPNGRIHEGGGINVQHAKQLTIENNTIFNNQGSGIRLDNRFYIPDDVQTDWDRLIALDHMEKTANINNNIIVGNKSSAYPEYITNVYGIEKRVAMYCGADNMSECAGTSIIANNNIIANNQTAQSSSNISLSASNNEAFPGFVNAPEYNGEIREISFNFDTETMPDFNLIGNSHPTIGAPDFMVQRSIDLYNTYRAFFRNFDDLMPDSDNDGITDDVDNCIQTPNSNQRDSNNDGFGNLCDADLDNNGFVNFADLSLFKAAFGSNDADADFDGNGFVNFADLAMFKAMFGQQPGPAGSSLNAGVTSSQ